MLSLAFVAGLLFLMIQSTRYTAADPRQKMPWPLSALTPEPTAERTPAMDSVAGMERWSRLVEECVELSKELDEIRVRDEISTRDLLDHVLVRLQQLLERCGVESIVDPAPFNRRLHRATPGVPKPNSGTYTVEVLAPGFCIGERVLLRARVRLAAATVDGVGSTAPAAPGET